MITNETLMSEVTAEIEEYRKSTGLDISPWFIEMSLDQKVAWYLHNFAADGDNFDYTVMDIADTVLDLS